MAFATAAPRAEGQKLVHFFSLRGFFFFLFFSNREPKIFFLFFQGAINLIKMLGSPSPSLNRLRTISYQLFPSESKLNNNMTQIDPFVEIALAPEDGIFALTAAFKADSFDQKVNVGVGAYRDNAGKPYVLPVVRKVRTLKRVLCPSFLGRQFCGQRQTKPESK